MNFGKKLLTASLVLLCLAAPYRACGQPDATADSTVHDWLEHYSVPDAPAFTMITTNPSRIVRPSSVKEFAVSMSQFFNGSGGFTVPEEFAVEVAPGWLLMGAKTSLAEYRQSPLRRALLRTRFSLGARRLDTAGNATEMALGLRTNIIDRSDLRMDPDFVDRAEACTDSIEAIYTEAIMRDPASERPDTLLSADEQHRIQALSARAADTTYVGRISWNTTLLQLAAAMKFTDLDTLESSTRVTDVAGWLTYAQQLGSWGQMLLNASGKTGRDFDADTWYGSALLGSRLYVGSRDYKGFLEYQGTAATDRRTTWLFTTGGEFMVYSDIWCQFSGGFEYDGGFNDAELVTDFVLKTVIGR